MDKKGIDFFEWITGYPSMMLLFAISGGLGCTGYYSGLFQEVMHDYVGLAILVSPIMLILFVQWGECSDKTVSIVHKFAALLFFALSFGMEIGTHFGYEPEGTMYFKVLAHLSWIFSWAKIYKTSKNTAK